MVEHATENRSVGGSIPPLGTIFSNEVKSLGLLLLRLISGGSIRGVILGNIDYRSPTASEDQLSVEQEVGGSSSAGCIT